MDKVKNAIDALKIASESSLEHYGEKLLIAYSGGKDSDVLATLCVQGRIDCEFVHSLTTADAPQTVMHVKRVFRELELLGYKCHIKHPYYKGAPTSMWKLIQAKGFPPTRLARYCCSVLKENAGSRRVMALGVRSAESSMRKARDVFEIISRDKAKRGKWNLEDASDAIRFAKELPPVFDCNLVAAMKRKGRITVNPLFDWTDEEVWQFIESESISTCELYKLGSKRVGCICCPFGGYAKMRKDGEDFPEYKRAYIRAFDKMVEKRISDGKPCTWSNGEDVWHWWVND